MRGALTRLARRRALIWAPPLTLLVAGCTYPLTIEPGSVANAIRSVVSRNTQAVPTVITCPTGVMATVGRIFTCHYLTSGDSTQYQARIRVTAVHGSAVSFYIQTSRG